jgi:hypothetical protein
VHLNFFIAKQLPVLPPDAYTEADIAFIAPRVLDLTYITHDLRSWAEELIGEWDAANGRVANGRVANGELKEVSALSPLTTNRSPFTDRPNGGRRIVVSSGSTEASGHSPFTIDHSPLPHRSPLATHHSPLTPFPFDPDRRAQLRAELDAYYARLYGLTREDLCYILDPASVMGEDYPSDTFRVLKQNELREFGEYRTQRLVLDAWGRLVAGDLH